MGNGEAPGPIRPTAPQDDVEIEDARTPSAAAPPAELALQRLQLLQHPLRIEIAFHKRDGIGEIAAGPSVSLVQDNRGCIEQPKILIQPRNRSFDDARRSAVAAMRAVRTDRDCVELRCT
jgi:hypothetical protein